MNKLEIQEIEILKDFDDVLTFRELKQILKKDVIKLMNCYKRELYQVLK